MSRWRTDCIEKPLSRLLMALGRAVGSHPWPFFILPMLISAALGGGFYFLKDNETNDTEEQFTPVHGPAKLERTFVKQNFPLDASAFSAQRLYSEGTFASLIVSPVPPGNNILSEEAFAQIVGLDALVRNLSVRDGGRDVTFAEVCAKARGRCVQNEILEMIDWDPAQIERSPIAFPQHMVQGRGLVFLGNSLGGVTVNESGFVQRAEALRLYYFLEENSEMQIMETSLWLDEFLEVFLRLDLKTMKISCFTSKSREEELEANSKEVIPLFSVTYFLAIGFSVVSCLRLDNVRNKAWVAIAGVISAGLAVLSSFGMLLYIGVPFPMTVANAPFLILGIGVDDMFIMISSWQKTKVHDEVKNRMAHTYKEAAISITITTLTDALAFYVGISTPFPSVKSFCLYTGTAVVFCYIYNITFFGAFLALNGRREYSNRHWLTCRKVPVESSPEKSAIYSICCTGGTYDKNTGTEEIHPVNNFFLKYYGPFLTKPWTVFFVVLLYAGYLSVSIYGCFQIKEGIDIKNLAPDDSYVVNYYNDDKEYFTEYGPNVMIVVTDEFPYWNNTARVSLTRSLEKFLNLPFIDKGLFLSWLDHYEMYANLTLLDISDETKFKANLSHFLELNYFKQDVNFTNNEIYASRFFIQTVNITNAADEENMLNKLRDTAKEASVDGLNFLVYHPAFIYLDQFAVVVDNTIQNILLATGAILVVSFLLIPNPLCSLWVTFSIASVIVGVAGFMALWDVNLDCISMIILVVCIGFSVDFSAHISYAFVSSNKTSAKEKAVEALFTLGYPIVQGALSTILGVVVLSVSKSYIFRTFFKIMFLVILFGAIHGIIYFPVFMLLFDIYKSLCNVINKGSKRTNEPVALSNFRI
ncbi:patched domain-containing protein 3-like [Scleropages formosus]|uniref:patched domain-containing protein 3-like n=1 Tax=Scleropages formosus TaxID=113540 RepID=UPI0010FA7F79|nr:patched domain-containing protein 3-like [Scleropages formosus]